MRRYRTSPRVSGRRLRASGQAIVEFALVAPVFFLIFFGILEFALITASIGSYNFATREGARLGSIRGAVDPNVDQEIVQLVSLHVQGIVMAKGYELDIYRANPNDQSSNDQCLENGQNPASTTLGSLAQPNASCAENVYSLPAGANPTPVSTNWLVSDRDNTLQNADYLGVRVLYQYTYLTGFVTGLGSTLSLTANSVQRIEPTSFSRRPGDLPIASVPPPAGRPIVTTGWPTWRPEDAGGGDA